mgnify:CR=1 FL=1
MRIVEGTEPVENNKESYPSKIGNQFLCSECGNRVGIEVQGYMQKHVMDKEKYCSNCGTKQRWKKDETISGGNSR